MKTEAKKILEFLHAAENLKKLIRHSWFSDGRHGVWLNILADVDHEEGERKLAGTKI